MKTTRRRFLQLTAGSAGFSLLPSEVCGRGAPGSRISLGVVGLGGMGQASIGQFLALDDVVVRAVCDVNAAKLGAVAERVNARAGHRGCAQVRDYRELCARRDIDAVVVATPDHAHAEVGIEAARCGKDVYGETPFTHTLGEGRALADAVVRHGRVWQSGSWQRSREDFRAAAAFVREGGLGRIARIEVGLPGGGRGPASSAMPVPVPPGLDWAAWQGVSGMRRPYHGVCDFHWRWVSAWGGGMLADWIGHYGDTALAGAGLDTTGPVHIEGCGDFPADGVYDTATAFSFRCLFRDGVALTVADGGRTEMGVGVRWIGEGGEWVWITRGAVQTSRPEILAEVHAKRPGPCVGLHRNFIDCVKSRRVTLAPAEAAHRAASLGHLGLLAMRTGCAVRFNPQTEVIS